MATASANESTFVAELLDRARHRRGGTAARDACRQARGDHRAPCCDHGERRFAGADYKRQATKWRCPTGECKPASRWVKADRLHPLIPRETPRFRKLYKDRT